jgi:hypothetical protein
MAALIPNLSTFYRTELTKKPSELVKALSKEVTDSIEFFSSHYIDNPEQLSEKYDLFLSEGYTHLNKILSYVEILSVKDDNQSNKFIYEDCYSNCIGVTKSVNSFHELRASEVSAKFNRLIDYSKIISNRMDLAVKANEYMEDIVANIRKQNLDIYNNYINQFIMSLVKLSVILSKLND